MPRKKPTRKDNRYEYKITLGRDIHGKPLRKSFYSTVSLADAKKKAEEFRVASEVSAHGEAFVRKSYNFSQWARESLMTYKQQFVSPNTLQTYEEIVRLYLASCGSVIQPTCGRSMCRRSPPCTRVCLRRI